MKAAVCRAHGADLVVESVDLARPEAGEVRVQLAACAICHSDIAYMDGAWGGDLPAVFGHEAAGVVQDVGPEVKHFNPGDHVVVTLMRSCGECPCCARGLFGVCQADFALNHKTVLTGAGGERVLQGMGTAAFAEEVLVDASQLVVIANDVPFDRAALLACGVITGYGAVANTARIEPGCDIAIIGAGGVGLNAIQGGVHCEANRIIAIDIADDKLDAAVEFGATHGVNSSRQDAIAEIRALTGGRGADYVFITVGAKTAFDQSYAMLAPGGAAVLVGMPSNGVMSEFEPGAFAGDGQRILGSKMGSADIRVDVPRLAELYIDGRLKLDELISNRFPLEGINEAIAGVKRGEARRNVIVFDL
jgi:Zn-dependent alcohol dehydrogenase